MRIEITYPPAKRRNTGRHRLMTCCKWVFLFAGSLCAAVNISTGGNAWSILVIWSMWLVWAQLVSPDMVEYNRISQTIKLIINSCILLFLIDAILAPGWAAEVVSIVSFSALILTAVLFFTDFETQRQNMFPMLLFCALCLIGSVIGLCVRRTAESWPLAVLCVISFSLLAGCAAKLGKDLLRELKKHFCAK